jgi:hypothetical protein
MKCDSGRSRATQGLPQGLQSDRCSPKSSCCVKTAAIGLILSALPGPSNVLAESDLNAESLFMSKLVPDPLDIDNAKIGNVVIDNRNIFDPTNPAEDRWLYRMANALHIRTRPQVIQSQLLFEEGDIYAERTIEESERMLRNNRYIGEANIEAVNYEDGVVDLNVKTTDVWSLNADVSFGRQGGENSGGIGIEEYNLFGTGTYVAAKYKSNVDRDYKILDFAKQQLFGSRYDIAAGYSSNSDGFERRLNLGKPFYSLDSRSSLGTSLLAGVQTDTLYDLGEKAAQYVHDHNYYDISAGWSNGLRQGWTRRITSGVVYDANQYEHVTDDTLPVSILPEDRRYVFPFIGFELVEDQFETVMNFDQIQRKEDLHIGARVSARLGYSSAAAGSSATGLHFVAAASNGSRMGENGTLLYGAEFGGRLISGTPENMLFSTFANYHWRQSEKRLLYVGLDVTLGDNLDVDNPVLLGGDSGLRGYPLRYQTGSSRALLTIEQRWYTDWYPFRLFRVGAAAFIDVGQSWGYSPIGAESLGLLRDVGVGLRLGNPRSGVGRMLHIDLAFPLDGGSDIRGTQLLIEAKRSF